MSIPRYYDRNDLITTSTIKEGIAGKLYFKSSFKTHMSQAKPLFVYFRPFHKTFTDIAQNLTIKA